MSWFWVPGIMLAIRAYKPVDCRLGENAND